ncbi:hypothetical protein NOM01_04400 [Sporolactobacillus sp. STSJ-5]|uniref:hypothetical protein n=1 Tax=Sporolactobacillus sp. STSJ-5 TaxID=2965076 RepID=UPI002102E620|nr:hypothetical protein [Sporolactobacillus sp. STSJ-5]MCQ2009234.1 hypothetical protein [Sporolactobacillus sp. STSJ-5]
MTKAELLDEFESIDVPDDMEVLICQEHEGCFETIKQISVAYPDNAPKAIILWVS